MSQVAFEKVVAEVKGMSIDEQRQLRNLLDEMLSSSQTRSEEDEFERRLFEAGLLSEIKHPITDFTPYQNRKPVEHSGKPLSETIIEDRR